MITDTHAHLFGEEFAEDLSEVVERAKDNHIVRVLMPNIDMTTVKNLLSAQARYPDFLFPMLGFHPTSITDSFSFRQQLTDMKKVLEKINSFVAIGEIGLDLYWDKTFQREQEDALIQQIEWGIEFNLPLMIHSRAAHRQLINIMSHYKKEKNLSGVFHSFSGTDDEACELLDFDNFCLGINGILTFKNSKLPIVIKNIPLSRILAETDSPYLAPVPYRGRRNESSFIVSVVQTLGRIYELPEAVLEAKLEENVHRVFKKLV